MNEKTSRRSQEKQLSHKSSTSKNVELRASKSSLSSTDDDNQKSSAIKKTNPQPQHEKRKPSPQKSSVIPPVIPSSGAKVPPSVLAMQRNKALVSKSAPMTSISKTISTAANKIPKKVSNTTKSSNSNSNKKKSIFSPDNSSESEEEEKPSVSKADRRPSASSAAGRGRGRPRKYPLQTNSTSSKSSNTKSVEKVKQEIKKDPSSASSTTESSTASSNTEDSGSESANEAKPSRKSARQSSVRKSKHVAGSIVKSETETDDSMKRSTTKSPVKKVSSLIPTKGKSKQKRIEQKHNLNLSKDSQPEEKGCPYDGCNSIGHLSGNYDKHFILEACPMYHNLTISETKQNLFERKKRSTERMKALCDFDSKKPQSTEQKNYLQKIRDLRSKFKPPSNIKQHQNDENRHDEKEPNLNGIVSDYDLQLFRDAQAIASENIENELKQLPCQGSVKFVVMGKHVMEVWYQSVYPEDVQRLPKLWLCEFCLRYQKSEVGMKRHCAKCVWRHPPGGKILLSFQRHHHYHNNLFNR